MGPRVNRGEQPEFAPCGQRPQARGRAGPCPGKDKRPHIPHSGSQGDLPEYTCTEGLLEDQGGSIASLVMPTYLEASSLEFILAKRCSHTWEDPR